MTVTQPPPLVGTTLTQSRPPAGGRYFHDNCRFLPPFRRPIVAVCRKMLIFVSSGTASDLYFERNRFDKIEIRNRILTI